jgi:hypothetical protein
MTIAFMLGLYVTIAAAQPLASGDETPTADAPRTSAPASALASAKAEDEEFKPPVGFAAKKHGALTLYCKRDTIIGTRFKTEKCYSEAQMRDYVIAQQENKRDIDRVRNTCSSGAGDFCATH